MKDIEKLSDDMYLAKQQMRPGWFCSIVVILGTDGIGLIDTGFENTPEDLIFPLIQELGRRPEEIEYVVNTHRDGDHVLGNNVIKEVTGARIAIHELEAEAVKTVDIKLTDGDIVKLGNRKFKVIHTPGHRPGSICLYDQKNKILITGDSVCGDRVDLIRMDKNVYINSLKELVKLDVKVLVMSHPFQPLGKSVLVGDETKEMIEVSIGIAEKL
jgi:glyoxylase-like metal-dependent hydrolase (beta-lactamase superfamily II)